jgi:hypothetical protein
LFLCNAKFNKIGIIIENPVVYEDSGNTNDDNSHMDDLTLTEDRGVDAVIQSDTFKDDSSMIPFSCTIFSDVMIEVDGNRLSRSLPDDFSSCLCVHILIFRTLTDGRRTKTCGFGE